MFPDVRFLPGDTLHFFASNQPGTLVTNAQSLLDRLRSRKIQTSYVSEAYLPFELDADRVDNLAARIRPLPDTPLNLDFAPIAYYFDVVLWGTRFNLTASRWLTRLAGIGFGNCLSPWPWPRCSRANPPRATPTGLRGGLFRAGRRLHHDGPGGPAAAGFPGGLRLRLSPARHPDRHVHGRHGAGKLAPVCQPGRTCAGWRFQTVAAAAPLALCLIMEALPTLRAAFMFPVPALLCGLIGGFQFPVASRIDFSARRRRSPGALYALDLAGSSSERS